MAKISIFVNLMIFGYDVIHDDTQLYNGRNAGSYFDVAGYITSVAIQ